MPVKLFEYVLSRESELNIGKLALALELITKTNFRFRKSSDNLVKLLSAANSIKSDKIQSLFDDFAFSLPEEVQQNLFKQLGVHQHREHDSKVSSSDDSTPNGFKVIFYRGQKVLVPKATKDGSSKTTKQLKSYRGIKY